MTVTVETRYMVYFEPSRIYMYAGIPAKLKRNCRL